MKVVEDDTVFSNKDSLYFYNDGTLKTSLKSLYLLIIGFDMIVA